MRWLWNHVCLPSHPLNRHGVGAVGIALFAVFVGCASAPRVEKKTNSEYAFWPAFPAEPRVQFLVSYRLSSDIIPPRSGFQRLVFGGKAEALPINKPYGVEMWDGKIYVCDIRAASVVVLDLKQKETRVLISRRLGGLSQPVDIAIAPDGTKYIADLHRGLIFVFDAKDRSTTAFGWSGLKPSGVAVAGDELFVTDFTSQSVVVMDRYTGEKKRQIGEPGSEDGQFVMPLGVEVANNKLFTCDVIRCRVQEFTPTGVLQGAFGEIGDSAGMFVRPKQMGVDSDGIIYVVDAAFQNVQMFNKDGHILMFFGSAGTHPGSMNLPAGLCVHEGDLDLFTQYIHPAFDANRLILVTNQFGGNKVSVYAMGGLKKGYTVQDLAGTIAPVAPGVKEEEGAASPTPQVPRPESPDEPADDAQPGDLR